MRIPHALRCLRGPRLVCCRAGSHEICLVTLNCLTQTFATREVFDQIDPRFLAQEHRFSVFLDEIERYAPSLLLLQESSIVEWPRLVARLEELGFDGIQQKRTTPVVRHVDALRPALPPTHSRFALVRLFARSPAPGDVLEEREF